MLIYGIAEIAQALQVTRQVVAKWHERGKLPSPDEQLAMGPVWKAETIEPWIIGNQRPTGDKPSRPSRGDASLKRPLDSRDPVTTTEVKAPTLIQAPEGHRDAAEAWQSLVEVARKITDQGKDAEDVTQATLTAYVLRRMNRETSTEPMLDGTNVAVIPEARLGLALRQARKERGISLRHLARKLYRSHSSLVEYERGHRLAPAEVVERYESELGLVPGTLLALREKAYLEIYGDEERWHRRTKVLEPSSWLRGLSEPLLSGEQERALSTAAQAAIERTVHQLRPESSDEDIAHLAAVLAQVLRVPVSAVPLEEQPPVLQALQARIEAQLAVLDDPGLTDTGQSVAGTLGFRVEEIAQTLVRSLLQEILTRGAGGGPLAALADQLNHQRALYESEALLLPGPGDARLDLSQLDELDAGGLRAIQVIADSLGPGHRLILLFPKKHIRQALETSDILDSDRVVIAPSGPIDGKAWRHEELDPRSSEGF